ncbi:FAD-binding oxidoreductase [Clostridium gasigenes]|uniref:FAD-binding oxidoreductase n=1 Tax=Clostridium gasigenes TaxID=94869 RepID=UPI003391026A
MIDINTIKDVYKKDNAADMEEIIQKYSNTSSAELEYAKSWTGFKELILVDKVKECNDIISFYFKDKEGKKLIKHIAGQYLPIKIKNNDDKYNNEIRTYTLSMKPNEHIYRISVKKVEGGLISSYLHDELEIGHAIEAMVPAGLFTLENNENPVVLISAGIGITPLISMLYDAIEDKKNITFIQAVQNSKIQPFKYDIKKLEEIIKLKNYVFYSNPLEVDEKGKDYDVEGFIGKEWIENNLDLNSEFYFCGPPIFMKILNKSLIELGVNRENIHFEFFGEPQSME